MSVLQWTICGKSSSMCILLHKRSLNFMHDIVIIIIFPICFLYIDSLLNIRVNELAFSESSNNTSDFLCLTVIINILDHTLLINILGAPRFLRLSQYHPVFLAFHSSHLLFQSLRHILSSVKHNFILDSILHIFSSII